MTAAAIAAVQAALGAGGFHGRNKYLDLDSLATVARTLAAATLAWRGVR